MVNADNHGAHHTAPPPIATRRPRRSAALPSPIQSPSRRSPAGPGQRPRARAWRTRLGGAALAAGLEVVEHRLAGRLLRAVDVHQAEEEEAGERAADDDGDEGARGELRRGGGEAGAARGGALGGVVVGAGGAAVGADGRAAV